MVVATNTLDNTKNYFSLHNHTDQGSNNRFLDSMNGVTTIIDKAVEKGLGGIGLTDHQALSSHIKAEQHINNNPEKFKNFKVTYGDEIYLVDKDKVDYDVDNNIKTDFYHFVLTAKNKEGYKFLRELSSKAWKDSFYFRGMRRLPTYKDWLQQAMKNQKGNIVASTACLGSELSNLLLKLHSESNTEESNKYVEKINSFINYLIKTFGKENIYFELMPSFNDDQKIVNKGLVGLSKATDIPYIITTDSHYIDNNDKEAHETFLHSENAYRDVKDFYEYAHLFTYDELKDYFNDDILEAATENSKELLDAIQPIQLGHQQEIPKSPIPEFKPVDLSNYNVDWSKYPLFETFINSDSKADNYYMYLLFNGLKEKNQELNHTNLDRINTELRVIKTVGDYLNSSLTQYFLTTREIIDTAWNADSMVGPGRGSVGCFYTAYLLDITQVNAIEHDLPYWRFLSEERKDDMPDVDMDTESSQRLNIINGLKDKYGYDKVLNFATFNTSAAKSTILSACRGLGINLSKAQNIVDLLPKERMENWSIHDAIYGNDKKDRQPDEKFINAIKQYPNLLESVINIENKVRGVSQHASGVMITNEPYTNYNAMMQTSKGLEVTQYEAHDSEYAGALKYDILTLNALDRIHEAIRLLLKNNEIAWQGSFKDTYAKYFSPDKLEMEAPKMFDMLFAGEVINAFQFSTTVGRNTLEKMNARTFDELVAANALMRLTVEDGEQPIDKYLRYRKNIKEWYQDMKDAGLSNDEMDLMKKYLSKHYGVCYSQESLMAISMDENITGFNLLEANKLRKSIAKKDHKLYEKEMEHFYEKGKEQGTSKALLDYVWNECAEPAKFYSYNLAHGTTYTMILMVEMNICYKFGAKYWKTACLSVNSGIYGDEFESPDYAKLANAAGNLKSEILSPDINKSDYGFAPYNDKILYGIYPIVSINKDDCKEIMNKRPYTSFGDFVKRTELPNRKTVQLIKAGCFDNFNSNRFNVMKFFVDHIIEDKKRLTTAQIPKLQARIPKEFSSLVELYNFRKTIKDKKFKMNKDVEDKFFNDYYDDITKEYDDSYTFDKGILKINLYQFEKWYKKQIQSLSNWFKTDKAIKMESNLRKNEYWKKYCLGNPYSWEMDSIGFYTGTHELDSPNMNLDFKLDNYSDLPKKPNIERWYGPKNNKMPSYQRNSIYGTVIDKNTNKNLIYLLTNNGVANIRLGKNRFIKYNQRKTEKQKKKNVVVEDSWFKRGTKLIIVGFRRGNDFIANNKQTGYQNSLYKINGYGRNAYITQR